MEAMQIESWYWLIFGFLLMALEVVAPAMVLMWFGFGAIVTGIALWLFPSMAIGWQLLTFGVVSLGSVIGWRKSPYFREESVTSDKPELGNRLTSHIGKQYTLTEAIINGRGSIRVGDTSWRVTGPELPAGTRVKVTGVEGVIFTVEQAG